MGIDENLEIVNWPKESGDYKIVQLYINKNTHIRFAESFDTHGIILMRLLKAYTDKDLPYVGRSGCKLPSLEGRDYKVTGMGYAKVNLENNIAIFSGESYDYSIGIDKAHLEKIKPLITDWKIY